MNYRVFKLQSCNFSTLSTKILSYISYGGTCADNETQKVKPSFQSVGREPSRSSSCIQILVLTTHTRGFGNYQRLTEIAFDLRKKRIIIFPCYKMHRSLKLMTEHKTGKSFLPNWLKWKLWSDKPAE